jgi:predicted transcriptional regulator
MSRKIDTIRTKKELYRLTKQEDELLSVLNPSTAFDIKQLMKALKKPRTTVLFTLRNLQKRKFVDCQREGRHLVWYRTDNQENEGRTVRVYDEEFIPMALEKALNQAILTDKLIYSLQGNEMAKRYTFLLKSEALNRFYKRVEKANCRLVPINGQGMQSIIRAIKEARQNQNMLPRPDGIFIPDAYIDFDSEIFLAGKLLGIISLRDKKCWLIDNAHLAACMRGVIRFLIDRGER